VKQCYVDGNGGLAMDDILSMIGEFEEQGYTAEQIATITGYPVEELKC